MDVKETIQHLPTLAFDTNIWADKSSACHPSLCRAENGLGPEYCIVRLLQKFKAVHTLGKCKRRNIMEGKSDALQHGGLVTDTPSAEPSPSTSRAEPVPSSARGEPNKSSVASSCTVEYFKTKKQMRDSSDNDTGTGGKKYTCTKAGR